MRNCHRERIIRCKKETRERLDFFNDNKIVDKIEELFG